MYYAENLKGLLINTAKGFGVGFIVSVILNAMIMGSFFSDASGIIGFMILFGACFSMFFCSRGNVQGFMSNSTMNIMSGITGAFFSGISGGGVFLVLWAAKAIIGCIIMIPVLCYMAISYVLNIIYFTIMFFLEKNNVLNDKEELCNMLDKIVPAISAICVVFICVKMIGIM